MVANDFKTLGITRREMLRRATVTGVILGFPTIIPGRALGLNGAIAPSERINLGGIGIRNRGTYVLGFMLDQPDVHFVAVADVRADRRSAVKELADKKNGDNQCRTYRDFRELLDCSDIDAVLVATGDRWHAPVSMLAAEAGKDVYSEKPCAISIDLCRRLANTIAKTERVFQAGTQRRSVPNFQYAVELARSGKLGRLRTLHASIYKLEDNHSWLPAQPEPPKGVVDWDMWLGPAPWRPFNQQYVDGGWRGYYDFDSGSKLLDWAAHTLDLCQWAHSSDQSCPVEYEPLESKDDNVISCTYADGTKILLRANGWLGLGACPVRFEGDDGWIETGDNGQFAVSSSKLRKQLPPPTKEDGVSPRNHVRNFFNCVKTRAKPVANADVAAKSHVACHAAALAWKLGRKLRFDPDKEQFIDDDVANRMCSRAMREPWSV